MRAQVPGLTIQPLLENAIYHGIEPSLEGGTVTIDGGQSEQGLWIRVRNPMPSEAQQSRQGNRIALDNIRERFQLAYGPEGEVRVEEVDGCFTVTLGFPYRE